MRVGGPPTLKPWGISRDAREKAPRVPEPPESPAHALRIPVGPPVTGVRTGDRRDGRRDGGSNGAPRALGRPGGPWVSSGSPGAPRGFLHGLPAGYLRALRAPKDGRGT